jgi:transcription termination factor Rho
MAVLERSELEASPLADLHAIANEVGIDGFRRLRKADLINAILGEPPTETAEKDAGGEEEPARTPRARSRRAPRSRRSAPAEETEESAEESAPAGGERNGDAPARRSRRGSRGTRAAAAQDSAAAEPEDADADTGGRVAEGVVEVLGNGSAFLRVDPPEPSDQDVYISAAQVRRCELVTGDKVSGPARTPRRSERYPSLVRIDAINGAPADSVADGARYDELPVAWPSERIALGSDHPTLEAIEWLTPIGQGSRAVIVGARHTGKSETLRRLLDALAGRDELEISLVLVGVRPEEISQWQEGPVPPAAALSFAASPDSQSQALERVLDAAKRVAARGGNALVLIDALDGLAPQAARRALAAARNLREAGSLTVIATAAAPLGGETTVIALDAALTSTGSQPILDLVASGTLRPDLLVGEDGAEAIAKARAAAIESR